MSTDTRRRLIEAATSAVRERGYHAVSFRDLARELGIKSASVHYHFPQKADLGDAIVADYSADYFATLELRTGEASDAPVRLQAMCDVHRDAFLTTERHCLCGLLGAEARGLPESVRAGVNRFLDANILWVHDSLPVRTRDRTGRARQFVATLQGAMMLAAARDDPGFLDDAVSGLLTDAARW